jgi:hypothetical protein
MSAAATTGGIAPLRGASRAAAVLASHSRHASADAGAVGAPHFEQQQLHDDEDDDEDHEETDEEEEEQQHEEHEEQTDGNISQQQEDESSAEDQQQLANELQRSSLADHNDAHAGAEPDDQQHQNDDNAEPADDGDDFEDNEDDGEGSGGATTSNGLPIIADDGANRDDSGAVDTSSVYAAFGRDTAAGRALFKLYNKNKTHYAPGVVVRSRAGGPLDPQQEAERLRRIEAERLKKPKYKAPQLKRAPSAGSGLDRPVGRVPLGGGKKTVEVIERERARDAHLYRAPATSAEQLRMQSREEAKRKLQDAMEGKRAAKPAPLPGRGRSGSAPAPAPPRDPNQVLLDQIVAEIEERTAFLDAMRARGDESHTETIKGEIAARLRDIRQLERIIAEEEDDRTAVAAAASSSQQQQSSIGGQRRASPSPPPLATSAAAAAGGAEMRSSAGRKR